MNIVEPMNKERKKERKGKNDDKETQFNEPISPWIVERYP